PSSARRSPRPRWTMTCSSSRPSSATRKTGRSTKKSCRPRPRKRTGGCSCRGDQPMPRPRSDCARRCVRAAFFVALLPTLFALCRHGLSVRPRFSWSIAGETHFCCFSPDGRTLVTRTLAEGSPASGPLRLWDVATGRQRLALATGSPRVTYVGYSPDSRLLSARIDDRRLKLWDPETGEEGAEFRPVTWGLDYVSSCFTPDSRFLVFQCFGRGGVDPRRCWDVRAKQVRGVVNGYLGMMTFAPDGRHFGLLQAPDGRQVTEVQVWALGEGSACATLTRREKVAGDVLALAPDLRGFASAAYPHGSDRPANVKVWDLATATVTSATTHLDEGLRIGELSFSPDGKLLVARSRGEANPYGKWTVWDISRGLDVVYQGFAEPVFSPDGQWLAVRD